MDGFTSSQTCAVPQLLWCKDHSLFLGLISMYYIIFFWMCFFNAMSRFGAWSLKLPTVACSALGSISSCWAAWAEDSYPGGGEWELSLWGLETNCLREPSLVTEGLRSTSEELEHEKRRANGLLCCSWESWNCILRGTPPPSPDGFWWQPRIPNGIFFLASSLQVDITK